VRPYVLAAITFLSVGMDAAVPADVSIAIQIRQDRHALVREHFALPGNARPLEFVFLASQCGGVENIRLVQGGMGHELSAAGSGPWRTVRPPVSAGLSAAPFDVYYDVVPVAPNARSCGVPLLMPQMVLEPVGRKTSDFIFVRVEDAGSGISNIAVPHLQIQSGGKAWSASFPAIPSKVEIEWRTGGEVRASPGNQSDHTGLFYWNFFGLLIVLVTWTALYLLWARAQPRA